MNSSVAEEQVFADLFEFERNGDRYEVYRYKGGKDEKKHFATVYSLDDARELSSAMNAYSWGKWTKGEAR